MFPFIFWTSKITLRDNYDNFRFDQNLVKNNGKIEFKGTRSPKTYGLIDINEGLISDHGENKFFVDNFDAKYVKIQMTDIFQNCQYHDHGGCLHVYQCDNIDDTPLHFHPLKWHLFQYLH